MENSRLKKYALLLLFVGIWLLAIGCDGGGLDSGQLIINSDDPLSECGSDGGALLGPPVFAERAAGKPAETVGSFTKGDFDVCLFVETIGDKSPGAAVVMIDDKPFAFTSDFNANFKSLVRRIPSAELSSGERKISVKLFGKPCSDKVGSDDKNDDENADEQKQNEKKDKDGYSGEGDDGKNGDGEGGGGQDDDTTNSNGNLAELSCGGLKVYLKPARVLWPDDGITREQIYAYQNMARLLQEEERPLEFVISLKKWFTPAELYDLIQNAGETETNMLYADIRKGDSFMRTPLSINGNEDLINMSNIIQLEHEECLQTSSSCEKYFLWILEDGIESGLLRVGYFRVYSTPRNMSNFWDSHPGSIRFIQTIADDIDNSQYPYSPDQEVY